MLVAALIGQWWWFEYQPRTVDTGDSTQTAQSASTPRIDQPAPVEVPKTPEPKPAPVAKTEPAPESAAAEAERVALRRQANEQRRKATDLEIKLRDVQMKLDDANREVELLRARPEPEAPQAKPLEFALGGVDPRTFEIEKDGGQVKYRVQLARALTAGSPIDDSPVKITLGNGPTVSGNIRMVIVPLGNRNERIYEPVEAWKRENGWPIDVSAGVQTIEGRFEMPDSGIDEVRLEVLRYGPGNGYTLIRRVTRWPDKD